ncbi:hypothetical protein [Polymorphospora rubra]|uniref:hypothetical protein n=1 Tax=Polymorphospora rubra TaxID=338584 RepID=UPI0033FD5974
MPEGRDAQSGVDWASLVDAYGAASDLPEFLHALRADAEAIRRGAYQVLVRRLVRQGSRFDASAAAAGPLIDLVADPQAPDRFAACQLLQAIAIGGERY